ncbi:MAG: transposase [Gemmataceae bacterium]
MVLIVRELIRPTHACRTCESPGHNLLFTRATLPPEPIPKSGVGSGLLVHVIVSIFIDHLPRHRHETIFVLHKWDMRRSRLCDHLRNCGELLTPLYDLIHQLLLPSFAINADVTPLVVLRPRRAAYAWVYVSDKSNQYAYSTYRLAAATNYHRRSWTDTASSPTPTTTMVTKPFTITS